MLFHYKTLLMTVWFVSVASLTVISVIQFGCSDPTYKMVTGLTSMLTCA